MDNQLKEFLEHIAYKLRVDAVKMTTKAGSGHPTSCLSAADLVVALFFYAMYFDPKNFQNPNNDRFILSKGHASPLLYAAWKEAGAISEDELMTYRQVDSALEGHPTLRFPYTEAATGALGIGLSIGAGMSLAAKMDKRDFYTYVLLGDSEISEGCIWEAAEIAAYYKLNHLVGIVDCNRLGQTGETMHGYHVDRYVAKFEAFGWHVLVIEGHDMQQIMEALEAARTIKDRPTMIIAKTIKGYGVARSEDKNGFHGKAFAKEELDEILAELAQRFSEAANYVHAFEWRPSLPLASQADEEHCVSVAVEPLPYKKGDMVPTRKAYGQALAVLGEVCPNIVSLDAEVNNSTFASIFAAAFPDRFVQCFIAEQNMIGMGVGMAARGKIPFISTFAAFLTRAHDQIRMASVGNSNLRISGSHAGVSIGQDGPSQMGLEDIAMMRALPESVVLYPADAVSTAGLMERMLEYTKGISYVRTTRMAMPVIYDNEASFVIGGCNILHSSKRDVACVVAAGVTLFEALKAYETLQKQGINIAVIDLYSIKPLDRETVLKVARQANSQIITVEDHYPEGGLGEAVMHALDTELIKIHCLAVNKLPRSGKPEELLALAGIDAAAIIKQVQKIK